MDSRQSLAEHGFGERSEFFRENTLSQKIGVFRLSKNFFDSLNGLRESLRPFFAFVRTFIFCC
jgi:hypothetical protein